MKSIKFINLISLKDPGVGGLFPGAEIFLSKPESDLVICSIHRVGAVTNVASNL